ncbi:MAG: methylmalonyl-CoA epimerase [Dehalococcoidia bacterium]|nr:methylmalonyl-CoA epimerase [Dehalococcoidia bacterium]
MADSPCTARHINHVALAVSDIDETLAFYRDVFGTGEAEVEDIEDQAVRAALVRIGGSQLELIQPTDPEGGVAKFIERRGEGVHHIAFEVDDLQASLDALNEHGVRTIDNAPREGLSGMIGFIHPRSTRGVLIELVDQDTARR